ncbi:MAG: FAD-dependent oxidoreductase [Burkholderiaceae bacterium]|jgi:predicted NAD/FAD-dependent oxidoreductase|nr:FAD-dependent oxidoreductase [Burkholderiaceae bacterium]
MSTPSGHRAPRHFAIIGAGMAGIACARTLAQAGHRVHLFERESEAGGRMACIQTPLGAFDSGAQFFTVRDPLFVRALKSTPDVCRPWSANAIRVLDAAGQVVEAAQTTAAPGYAPPHESPYQPAPGSRHEPHWVAVPGMDALLRHWAAPLGNALVTGTQVDRIAPDAQQAHGWQVHTTGTTGTMGSPDAAAPCATPDQTTPQIHGGFDAVLIAVPPQSARTLLAEHAPALAAAFSDVRCAPCWTLMIAFPNANQPGLWTFGPQWNAARSTHHRIAWLARESSKPGRELIERWTVQASPDWSAEHLQDDPARVRDKLLRAFAEITGIRAEPALAQTRCWVEAQTLTPLGRSHLWDAQARIGLAGDWCLGHRVEDAFVSGLSLALAVNDSRNGRF